MVTLSLTQSVISRSELTLQEAIKLQQEFFDPEFRTHRMGREGKWFPAIQCEGLSNPVQAEPLENLLKGLRPDGQACGVENSPVAALKLTCRAGSDLSMLWALAPRRERLEIESLHARVARNLLNEVQSSLAFCSYFESTEPQGLIAASFRCCTTPEQSPELHSTTFIVNMTQKSSGEFERLDLDKVARSIRTHYPVYEEELTERAKRTLGLTLEYGEGGERLVVGLPRGAAESFFSKAKAEPAAEVRRGSSELLPKEALFEKWSKQGEECGFSAREAKAFLAKSNRVRFYLDAMGMLGKRLCGIAAACETVRSQSENATESKLVEGQSDRPKAKSQGHSY